MRSYIRMLRVFGCVGEGWACSQVNFVTQKRALRAPSDDFSCSSLPDSLVPHTPTNASYLIPPRKSRGDVQGLCTPDCKCGLARDQRNSNKANHSSDKHALGPIGCTKAVSIEVDLPYPETGLDIHTGRGEGSPSLMAHPYKVVSRLGAEFQTAGIAVENRVSSGKEYPDGLTEHRSYISYGTCCNPGQATNSHPGKRCIPSQHLTEFPAYRSDRGGRILSISTTKFNRLKPCSP